MAYAFEDFTPGMTIDLGTATVDRDEMLSFARRFDPQPFHVDEQAAKNSMLGGLCASGWFTCSLWMRQYADHVLLDSTSQGSPGGRDLAWPAPVFPGIGLDCDLEVLTARRSASRPTMGLVEITGRARQRETEVLRITFTGIFLARS